MIRFYRALTFVASLLLIAACGGGGSLTRDDPGTPNPPPTPSFSVAMAITDSDGNTSNELSGASPLTVTATVTNQSGDAVSDVEVVFSFTQPNLATFDNDAGTGLTNASGEASIGLLVGPNSGSGSVVATLPGGETGQIGFTSSGTSPTEVVPASLEFFASATQLASSGGDQIELIAVVKNEQNVLLEGVTVDFSANNGASVQITQGITAGDGTARALVSTPNNPQNRTITATARTVNFEESLDIQVVGTEVNLSGPGSVVINAAQPLVITVADSDGRGIAGQVVNLSSVFGSLSNTTPVTDEEGQATVQYVASQSGTDIISASALNASGSIDIVVQEDRFTFIGLPASEVPVGTDPAAGATLTILWEKDGVPFEAGEVTFSASRGTLETAIVDTGANGQASTILRSADAGISSITAIGMDSAGNQVSARAEVEFLATDAAEIRLDASPDLIGPEGQTSTITALVRDAIGNLVKNKTVNFTLNDNSGGALSQNSAITDSNGIATVVYRSNAVSSEDAVLIQGRVADAPTVTDSVTLTVGDRAFDISLGTGRQIQIPDNTTYLKEFAVFVSDAVGRPVENVQLTVSQTPIKFVQGGVYRKGFWQWDPIAEVWVPFTTAVCPNEDINGNGALDPGEDTNGDGQLTPGIIGTITFANGQDQTDQNGQATLEYRYPKNLAPWTEREIRVFGQSTSSESTDSLNFTLSVAAEDVTVETSPPPSNPYGSSAVCTDTQ